MSERQSLNFRTNVLIKSIIGKDLINDDNIAVLELVKNSYDAASPTVDIIFKNLKQNDDLETEIYSINSSKIIIQDFGKGMDEDDIKDKWLNIAYSAKKSIKEENNRYLAGNKGVGRFSCDRLGEYLDLYTRKKDKDYYHLKINWKDFETDDKGLDEKKKQDLEIQQIEVYLTTISPFEFEQTTGYPQFEQGTILEISKLRSKWAIFEKNKRSSWWNVSKIEKLKKYLEKLINPNKSFQKTSFSIFLMVEEFKNEDNEKLKHERLNGEVESKIFEKLEFTATSIEASIDKTGKSIVTQMVDKGKTIFILDEKNIDFPLLKDVRIFLYYLNSYSKVYFTKQTGVRSVDFGSVFLFVNGFMIPPYGEEGNDWLSLELRRGQGTRRFLSTRDLVGRIEITDRENNFKIVSSREGVVNDSFYHQLTDSGESRKGIKDGYFYFTLKRLEKYVVDGLKWDRITGEDDLEEDESLSKKRSSILKDFEKKTQFLTTTEAQKEEVYYEQEIVKRKRSFSIIRNIIDVKKENINELYINENLILELIKEEESQAQNNIKKLLDEIDTLPSMDIGNSLKKIESSKNALQDVFDKVQLTASEVTDSKTLFAINTAKTIYQNFNETYTSLKLLVEKLRLEKEQTENKLKEEENENERLKKELELIQKRTTYLLATRKTLGEDADGLIHNIKLNTTNIISFVNTLTLNLKNRQVDITEILKSIQDIKFEAEKCLTVAKLATRVNFSEDDVPIDIPKFIQQYFEVYNDVYNKKDIEIEIENNVPSFKVFGNIVELSIVFDNLVSNAQKWTKPHTITRIKVNIDSHEEHTLTILFSDNGIGLIEKFIKNPNPIFDLGIYATPVNMLDYGSSGIGLYYTRKILSEKFSGTIEFLGNNIQYNGATFKIKICN